MQNVRRVIILIILVSISITFAGQIGPWSHFKAITSNYTVNAGDTLTINAGTEVRFSQGTIMTIFGVVISNGTSSDPVIFAALDPTNPEWGGITINNTDPMQVSVFNSTIFTKIYSYGDGAINILESSVNFNNCRFFGNHADIHGGAVHVAAGNVNFTTCVFRNNNADQGGAIYIYNDPINAASTININYCSFLANSASHGGGIYIEDSDVAAYNMAVSIENSRFHYNRAKEIGGYGGGLFLNIMTHLDLKLKYCKIQYNDALMSGGGIYAKFNETGGGDVLHQEFANLLITENSSTDGGGVYLNMGFTENPMNIDFINTTIAFNKVTTVQQGMDGGGIHLVSNGNYPFIKNTIIWGNVSNGEWAQFFIGDDPWPIVSLVFPYCDIQNGDWFGYDGLVVDPIFVRPPLLADNIFLTADRFDYHLSLNSPCIDAGDSETPIIPEATPELVFAPFIVNMGAYGNTSQASVPLNRLTSTPAGTVFDLNVEDGGVIVLDFEGKSKDFGFGDIHLGAGSQLHLKGANLATINIKSLTTSPQTGEKFNYERIIIQKVIEATDLGITKTLNISEIATLHGVEMSDMQLTIAYDPTSGGIFPNVDIKNSTISNSNIELLTSGILITDASAINIENTVIDNFKTGIQVENSGGKNKGSSKRITNNTITFDVSATQKADQQVGIQVQNSDSVEVSDNDIDNGDIGIQMSNSSKGRITNNTITFDVSATQKTKSGNKIAINVIGGTSTTVENNDIWIQGTDTVTVTAINVESSSAQIFYNKINFEYTGTETRNGIVLNNVLDTTYVYNNTIYNPSIGVYNTPGSYSVDFINNIIWNDNGNAGVSDTTGIRFFNNDIKTLGDITGTDNISSDPMCIDPSTNDLVINPETSPCMNTGLAVSGFHILDTNYYGDAPEIGYIEYYEITLTAPEDPTISMTDSTFTLGWSAVTGASSYDIFSSDDPYGTFTLEANVVTISWTDTDITSVKKFYYVIASESSKNAGYVRDIDPVKIVKEDEKYKVIKKRIPRKIRRTDSSNR